MLANFQITAPYRGSVETPKPIAPFTMHVRFTGPSVLEGFKEMFKGGIIAEPFPKHLKDVPSAGTNSLEIDDSN